MKTYKIESSHTVHIDDYKGGELDYCNSYNLSKELKAESPKEALKDYIEKFLYYEYEESYIDSDEGLIYTSYLVDVDNNEASNSLIKLWKKGKQTLYSNSVNFTIYELTQITEL